MASVPGTAMVQYSTAVMFMESVLYVQYIAQQQSSSGAKSINLLLGIAVEPACSEAAVVYQHHSSRRPETTLVPVEQRVAVQLRRAHDRERSNGVNRRNQRSKKQRLHRVRRVDASEPLRWSTKEKVQKCYFVQSIKKESLETMLLMHRGWFVQPKSSTDPRTNRSSIPT